MRGRLNFCPIIQEAKDLVGWTHCFFMADEKKELLSFSNYEKGRCSTHKQAEDRNSGVSEKSKSRTRSPTQPCAVTN